MLKNELINYQIPLALNTTKENITTLININMSQYSHLYSWILYDKIDEYLLSVLVSETTVYNTLPVNTLSDMIYDKLQKYKATKSENFVKNHKNVIAFKQPPLEILCETYRPLIYSLCVQQHTCWPQIELEDLIQMCNLRICILYQQGYYIHKKLLNKSFANAVLMFLRPEKYKPKIISLDQMSKSKSGEDESVNRVEVIEDEAASRYIDEAIDEIDGCTFEDLISKEMRNVVLEFVSQRTYDQWCLEYGTKTVSRQTASQVNALKSKLFVLGINRKNVIDYIVKRR